MYCRAMNGIPPLVELLRNDYPEVQKNALGALKNMSYGGKTENKVRQMVDSLR